MSDKKEVLKKAAAICAFGVVPTLCYDQYQRDKAKQAEHQAALLQARQNYETLKNTVANKLLQDSDKKDTASYQERKEELLFGGNVEAIQNSVSKAYLPFIAQKYAPVAPATKRYSYLNRIRVLQVKKWVLDQDENSLDKLGNVYSALSNVACSITLVYRRDKKGTKAYFVIANRSDIIDPAVVDSYYNLFVSALRGNFPGVEIEEVENIGSYEDPPADSLTGEWFSLDNSNALAMVTNIASESSEKFISQGIEKLLDGVVPADEESEYTMFLVAEPMTGSELQEQSNQYEEMYTGLSPYEQLQMEINLSTATAETSNLSRNFSVSQGSSHGLSVILANKSKNKNTTYSETSSFSRATTKTQGESLSSTRTNYRIRQTLQMIESHIERLKQGEALGMWKFASYILADTYAVAQNVASMYRSLSEGEESYIESAAINLWNGNRAEGKRDMDTIKAYLKAFTHPVFALRGLENIQTDEKNEIIPASMETYAQSENAADLLFFPGYISGYTMVSGKELSMAMNLPGAAVSGLPVIECAAFGRDVISQNSRREDGQSINLGNIFHMQQKEANNHVLLDADCMAEHTFITGSTGAGKSTTIYRLLKEASSLKTSDGKDVSFLVIEPAKGEYKEALGKLSDKPVFVYTTNPKITAGELLRINPFAFPAQSIHILEHLDRLMEIFNVCWPMYAAMPAVLKSAIEKAYEACGWDLLESENKINAKLFPTFADVCNHIRMVIDQSDYSADNKGDYKGALVTRLESLTNGINGLIFTADEIEDAVLFENNSIVDLSRVGSTETKALIMGLLVMKLQEYRIASVSQPNSRLKHITVLEEAHNLLKKTSSEQQPEGANLLGKSVEMLSNSIAEMRTYGEAFVIADQAPGLLDMSVIRNTNTKIIMRLPDFSDRELVGKSANLNDEQIIEIAKLRPGVAAVYYNGWINPVLCKVPMSREQTNALPANYGEKTAAAKVDKSVILDIVVKKKIPENPDSYINELIRSGYAGEMIAAFAQFCTQENEKNRNKLIPTILYLLFEPAKQLQSVLRNPDCEQLSKSLKEQLKLGQYGLAPRDEDTILFNLIHEHNLRTAGYLQLYTSFAQYYQEKYKGVN